VVNIFRFTKISGKLTIIYSLIFSLVLLFLSTSLLYGVKSYLYHESVQQVIKTGQDMANGMKSDRYESRRGDQQYNEMLSEVPLGTNMVVRILDANGNLLAASSGNSYYQVPFSKTDNRVLEWEAYGKHLFYQTNKIIVMPDQVIYLQVIKDFRNEHSFLAILLIFLIISDVIGILFSILAGFIVSRRMLQPIDSITKAAQGISASNLNERLEIKGPDDELTRLARTFNEMIERLQDSFERQNTFVSNASHELRTPIAVIQGYAEMIGRWGKDRKEILEESVSAIITEAAGMTGLVKSLLLLAKCDNNLRPKLEKYLLNELITEVTKESQLIAPNHRISNHANIPTLINADYDLIKQMLRALIDNSIKFTPPNGEVAINLISDKDRAVIVIKDTGIGIPKDELGYIFDRFYRVDKSRAKEKGGYGLGLSIVKSIIDLHDGKISVASELGKGTEFTIILPLVPPLDSHSDTLVFS
jgi:two-component system sensor histidine kinase ArlS